MEAIWGSLLYDDVEIPSLEWNENVLAERKIVIDEESVRFLSIGEFKERRTQSMEIRDVFVLVSSRQLLTSKGSTQTKICGGKFRALPRVGSTRKLKDFEFAKENIDILPRRLLVAKL